MTLVEVPVGRLDLDRFAGVVPDDALRSLQAAAAAVTDGYGGRVVWNVNSTARGGGVAEMLHSLIAYACATGVDARWVVIGGEERFFKVTKRIHNRLHGWPGDGGDLDDEARADYEHPLAFNAAALRRLVSPGDVVILHDPQTAGLAPALRGTGARVVWRAHIGVDEPNEIVRSTWAFLAPYVRDADAYVFSRREHVWDLFDRRRVRIIPPSIDAFAPKNQDLAPGVVTAIVAAAGLVDARVECAPAFRRMDGTPGLVARRTEMLGGPPPPAGAPTITQVSRWDRLKDPVGVVRAFADHVAPEAPDARLVLAGPSCTAVADDPEGVQILAETRAAWEALDARLRERVVLACLPMDDAEENAAIVNALQRHSTIVIQKSLAEGFGLTVAEAMWKARPVVASRVGGIQDQIVDGESGLLLADPTDLAACGQACVALLRDAALRERLGSAARERVRDRFLATRHLGQYASLLGAWAPARGVISAR